MPNPEHLALIKRGVGAWNAWRKQNPAVRPDLTDADLVSANLFEADLSGASLSGANLRGASLSEADLSGANLRGASLSEADLSGANLIGANLAVAALPKANLTTTNLTKADLTGAMLAEANLYLANLAGANLAGAALPEANLFEADLSGANLAGAALPKANLNLAYLSGAFLPEANLRGANLTGANLVGANLPAANLSGAALSMANLSRTDLSRARIERASLVGTFLTNADLTGCRVYGISAWSLSLEGVKQQDLIITPEGSPQVTVDNIEVAQFIYLLLHNEKIRSVIDTITSKVVLILGRFTPERKVVLDAMRDELRQRNYLPVVFDFEKPASQTTDETITLLARMSRFVIADISDAKSVLQELRAIVPDLPSVAVQPLILVPQQEPGMFDFFRSYHWVLEPHCYESQERLILDLGERIIRPAEAKVLELRTR